MLNILKSFYLNFLYEKSKKLFLIYCFLLKLNIKNRFTYFNFIHKKNFRICCKFYYVYASKKFYRYKTFVYNYEPDKILSAEEYSELTDVIYDKVKDHLDGRPMFFVEEYEDENIPLDGDNYEEMPKKLIRNRRVYFLNNS